MIRRHHPSPGTRGCTKLYTRSKTLAEYICVAGVFKKDERAQANAFFRGF